MAIKVQNTSVIDDSKQLQNIPNIRTIDGCSLFGSGDLSALIDIRVIKTIQGHTLYGDGNITLVPSEFGLGNVDNTSDSDKPVSTAQAIVINTKANTSSFLSHVNNSFNPHGVSASQVGLGNVTNESKATMFASPTFTGTPVVPTAITGTNTTQIASTAFVRNSIADVIGSAPGTLDTLNELAVALGNDANFATTVTNSLATKAPIASPTFTGTVSGITKSMVGLGNVDDTSDANKPISTATQTALDAKLNSSSFTLALKVANNLSDLNNLATAKINLGINNVDNTSDANKNVLSAEKFTTARKINGTSFDGTTDITISAPVLMSTHWTISESNDVLYFAHSGTNKAKLDSDGNLTVIGNVTAYGTV